MNRFLGVCFFHNFEISIPCTLAFVDRGTYEGLGVWHSAVATSLLFNKVASITVIISPHSLRILLEYSFLDSLLLECDCSFQADLGRGQVRTRGVFVELANRPGRHNSLAPPLYCESLKIRDSIPEKERSRTHLQMIISKTMTLSRESYCT